MLLAVWSIVNGVFAVILSTAATDDLTLVFAGLSALGAIVSGYAAISTRDGGGAEWVRRNVALVVALDVLLSLGLFGVLSYQQNRIDNNGTKAQCWDGVLGNIVIRHPPAITSADITRARVCQSIP